MPYICLPLLDAATGTGTDTFAVRGCALQCLLVNPIRPCLRVLRHAGRLPTGPLLVLGVGVQSGA